MRREIRVSLIDYEIFCVCLRQQYVFNNLTFSFAVLQLYELIQLYDPVIGLVLYATNSLQSFDFSSVYLLSISKGSFSIRIRGMNNSI